MQNNVNNMEMRFQSIEQRLDIIEKQAVTKESLEKEIISLLKKQLAPQEQDCTD